MSSRPTLPQFLLEDLKGHPDHETLIEVILDIARIGKEVSLHTSKAGLTDILGATGEVNIQNEHVQKLDVFANDLCKQIFTESKHFIAYASEEEDGVVDVSNGESGQYVIAFDPLDGSSNIDVNISIGTIFSVFPALPGVAPTSEEHFFQKGRDQVLAGYVLYGTSTVIVFSFGGGRVHEFTYDPGLGDYFLSNEAIQIPESCTYFSVNESYVKYMDKKDVDFIDILKNEMNCGARYIGSLVADVHRNLLKGGIFLYPVLDKEGSGAYKGKLRMAFELKPLAFIVEQAGGMATNGVGNILDQEMTSLHERAGVIIGNKKIVEKYLQENF